MTEDIMEYAVRRAREDRPDIRVVEHEHGWTVREPDERFEEFVRLTFQYAKEYDRLHAQAAAR